MADVTTAICDDAAESHRGPTEHLGTVPAKIPQNAEKAARHSKKLSINFPILVTSNNRNPGESSRILTPIDSPRLSPSHPSLAASSAATHAQSPQKPIVESTDFLTLLAAQERKVLELREELQRAESDMTALKRQWAVHEAGKKKTEVRQHGERLRRLSSAGRNRDADGTELREKGFERRRTLVERTNGYKQAGRKSGQRVFSGSRHARTLSLLGPNITSSATRKTGNQPRSSLDEMASPQQRIGNEEHDENEEISDQTRSIQAGRPSFSRTSTLPDLGEHTGGFGKTYKKVAGTGRRSMPPIPPSAEVLVKQGQRVAEGLKEGLWTFWEDIRQATVGDEGVSGVQQNGGLGRSNTGLGSQKNRGPVGGLDRRKGSNMQATSAGPEHAQKETSFWKEFGIETPRKEMHPFDEANGGTASHAPAVEVPDLLGDLEDDEWEAWESPTLPHDESISGNAESNKATSPKPKQGEGMPWPELKRLTPSKLTRTVSGLMREWEGDGERAEQVELDGTGMSEFHALASLQM